MIATKKRAAPAWLGSIGLTRFMRIGLAAQTLGVLACAPDRQPIALGLVGPFSEPRGLSMRLAAEMAVAELNRAGGVRGRPLELVIQDDSTRPEVAVAAARALYADPRVVAVIGHLTSGTTLAAAPVYGGRSPLPVISPSASAPAVSDAGPHVFRVCPTDVAHGTALAEFAVRRLGARSAAILYQNDEYGRGIRGTFAAEFARLGGRLASDDPYVPDLPSFEPYLRRLQQRGGADVLLIAGTAASARRILPTLDTVGMRPRVMGGDALAGLEATRGAEGVFSSTAYLPDQPAERNRVFVAAYRAAYGDQPLDHRGAAAYDIVHLLARATDAVGPSRRRLLTYLAGVGTASPAFDGVTGRVAFDSLGDVPTKAVMLGVVRGGHLVMAQSR
ncbi:MAG: amino acid ABC transporter substrate-binding protein [Gemmatimonadetes bacterium]|nr:amino acid ABC transporter substrate-binding protein [Gemmatimonadota bacterium]